VISRAGHADTHSGTSAGTSIMPAPLAQATANDHSASPVPAAPRRRPQGSRPDTWIAAMKNATPPASEASRPRPPITPNVASVATSAIDATWPSAIGASARQARARSPARTRHVAANIQPDTGLSPCSAPTPATASQGAIPLMAACLAQACVAQQDAAGAAAGS
jgi:hypothetical protein